MLRDNYSNFTPEPRIAWHEVRMSQAINFEELQLIVRSKTMSGSEAENFAHNATREILSCQTGRMLCDELVDTLCRMASGEELGERAVALVRQIETSSTPFNRNALDLRH